MASPMKTSPPCAAHPAPLLGRVPRLAEPTAQQPRPISILRSCPTGRCQTLNEEGNTMSQNTLQEPKSVELHRPRAIKLPKPPPGRAMKCWRCSTCRSTI
jgi:hypothetical protein